jgi:hypothetical protein
MTFEDVSYRGPMEGGYVRARAFARVGRTRFEFVLLRGAAEFETYDHPRSWGGVPRFVGYMPREPSLKLLELILRAVA